MNAADTLLRAIQNKLILTSNTFEDLNLDDALAGRDDLDFGGKWVRLDEKVKGLDLKEADIQMLDRLREVAFRTTYDTLPIPSFPRMCPMILN